MTLHIDSRDPSLRSLYRAIDRSTDWAESIEHWSGIREQIAGPLERKRKVDRSSVARILGLSESEFDLQRYLYAVELWIALVAKARLERLTSGSFDGTLSSLPDDLKMPSFYAPSEAVDEMATIVAKDPLVFADFGTNPSDAYGEQLQYLLPKQVRHTTGSYFTPAWLAKRLTAIVLEGSPNGPESSFLEPSCGPGVFLNEIVLARLDRGWMDASTSLDAPLIVGYEFNDVWAFLAQASMVELQIRVAADQQVSLTDLSWHRAVRRTDFLKAVDERLAKWPCRGSREQFDFLPTSQNDGERGLFDVILGNPPWINWEYLPPTYRDEIQDLWPRFGIFQLRALDKANSKEDIASLFTIAALHAYGSSQATLGFVLPASLFRSSLLGKGLRAVMSEHSHSVGALRIDEWTGLRPFGDAANNTVTLVATRGQTEFPVPWHKHSGDTNQVSDSELFATPVSAEPGATWMVSRADQLPLLRAIRGDNPYRGRTGVFTGGANAVYYVDIISARGTTVRVKNITERAKRHAIQVESDIEPDYLYPIVTGRDISFWSYRCSKYLICPHTAETKMSAVPPTDLATGAPLTYHYLESFSNVLNARRGFAGWERARLDEAFYSIQRIGEYSFAPYKVAWKYISSSFVLAVVQPIDTCYRGTVAPLVNDKVMSIGLSNRDEAFYVCGVLSSYPFRLFVESHMVSTQISPSVIRNLAVPPFVRQDQLHMEISRTCEEGHRCIESKDVSGAQNCLRQINQLVAKVIGAEGAIALAMMEDPLISSFR